MKPVRTKRADTVYKGGPGVLDLHCQRVAPGRIRSVWWLTPAERSAVARGANISLEIRGEPIPPVQLAVVMESGVGEDDPAILARLERFREGEL